MSALYRDFSAYPQPIRRQLEDAQYARCTSWKAGSNSAKVPKGKPERSGVIVKTLLSFEPGNEAEKIVHAETRFVTTYIAVTWIGSFLTRATVHWRLFGRARLFNVTTGLLPVLWRVVAFGALMNIVPIWMQDMEIHAHLVLGAVLAAILGAVIFLIAELDHAFRGA